MHYLLYPYFPFALIPIIGIIVNIALSLAYVAINLGCSAVIYKKLTVEASDKETIVPEPEATITAQKNKIYPQKRKRSFVHPNDLFYHISSKADRHSYK